MGVASACASAPPSPASLLRLDLVTDRDSYGPFDPVRISIVLTNGSEEPLRVHFPTSQRIDVVIRNESGSPIWRWSDGRRFSPTEGEYVLEGGGELRWAVTFEGRLAPGTYRVEGSGSGPPAPTPAIATIQVR
jgi:hypothetical protein